MRATVLYGAGDVRVENVPDALAAHPYRCDGYRAMNDRKVIKAMIEF